MGSIGSLLMLSHGPGQISVSMKSTVDCFKSHWGGELVPSMSVELSSTKQLSYLRSHLSPEEIWVANSASFQAMRVTAVEVKTGLGIPSISSKCSPH